MKQVPTLLPGSSEPCELEIQRLQQWCERAPMGIPVPSGDLHDFDTCVELISKIVTSEPAVELPQGSRAESQQSGKATETATGTATGTRLPRFANPRWIGSGAHGIIFSAIDTERENREVAIKILRPSRQRNQVTRERFTEEAKLMKGLSHPNIAVVVDLGVIEELPYMVTELANVGSLAAVLAGNPDMFTVRQAAWLVKQIAEAVHYAHSIPILHRDIKPGNILLRTASSELSEGAGVWPLLTDFGLSKNLGASPVDPRTRLGEILGTLAYMSPEQVRGESLKTQSDIFPLGVILYELAHGSHPFLGKSNFETQQKIVQGSIPKSVRKDRKVPRALEAIIAKCLEKNPEQRYRAASDLATDLNSFLHGQPISVSPPTPLELFSQLVRSNPIAATFVTTVFCALLTIILLLNREWRIQRELTEQTQLIAEDRAEIGALFLESMRVNNRGIYDTILSFQRVSTESLQLTLEKQIPLLESALHLDPSDDQLVRQLEVNYHYLSLCIKCSVDENNPESTLLFDRAIEARLKSLEYIDMLLKRKPEQSNLLAAKTNGLYWLSMLYLDNNQAEEGMRWTYQALAHAQQYLQSKPDDSVARETLSGIQLLLADQLRVRSPEESLALYRKVSETSLELFEQDPTRLSNLIYAIQSYGDRGALLLRLGSAEEARAEFAKARDAYDKHKLDASDEYVLAEELLKHYLRACAASLETQQYEMLLEFSEEWQAFVESMLEKRFDLAVNYSTLNTADMRILVPSYFQWVALSSLHEANASQLQMAAEALQGCVDRCVAHPNFNFDPHPNIFRYSTLGQSCLDGLTKWIQESQRQFAVGHVDEGAL